MSTVDYTYAITDNSSSISTTGPINSNITWGSTTCTVFGCSCNGYHYYYPYHTCPPAVKLYQIFCPRPGCAGKFWAEIDQTKACPVCKAKTKVTDKPSPDYEVAVTK
jgi:hypothetical protein